MIQEIKYPELIIAIVGAVGTDLDTVCTVIKQEIQNVGYTGYLLSLSTILTSYSSECEKIKGVKDSYNDEFDRLNSLMDAGDNFRRLKMQNGALAALAITGIWEIRKKVWEGEQKSKKLKEGVKPENIPLENVAYIIKSIKRPEEIQIFRKIYGKQLVVISVYASKEKRIQNLAKRLCKSNGDSSHEKYKEMAQKLVERDMNSSCPNGQNVEEAFPLADYFIEEMDQTRLSNEIARFVNIFFQHPFIEPTKHEFGMFIASAAAKRSLDLSRQVGASIASENGHVISVGCNDVPAYGGGCSWHPDGLDFRDYKIGRDYNVSHKIEILKEVFGKLKKEGWISEKLNDKNELELAKDSVKKDVGIINDCRINNLLEFGRIVHAEMDAITAAGRHGISTKDCILFCTTFPCHICSRHIIAAGIKKVFFIEPYPKSLTDEMYRDIVSLDGKHDGINKVEFLPFMGVSPKNFMRLFKRGKRKDVDGYSLDWTKMEKMPNTSVFLQEHAELEKYVVGLCIEKPAMQPTD